MFFFSGVVDEHDNGAIDDDLNDTHLNEDSDDDVDDLDGVDIDDTDDFDDEEFDDDDLNENLDFDHYDEDGDDDDENMELGHYRDDDMHHENVDDLDDEDIYEDDDDEVDIVDEDEDIGDEVIGQLDGTSDVKQTTSGQTQVTIGDKKFYVISKDGNKVTLSLTPRDAGTPNPSTGFSTRKTEGLKGLFVILISIFLMHYVHLTLWV